MAANVKKSGDIITEAIRLGQKNTYFMVYKYLKAGILLHFNHHHLCINFNTVNRSENNTIKILSKTTIN